jgi:poly-beta-1,6-N-acetyl-D-glucosamine synthase
VDERIIMHWIPVILILPYFFLLLKIYRNLLNITPFSVSSAPSTFVSVIIACRNEQEKLPALLGSIAMQDYPKELYEVLIVDDNSTDKTFETASEIATPHRIYLLKNEGRGKKEAIRTGINASRGKLIITTDADCTMGKSWIQTITAYFEENNPEMIICPVQLKSNGGFFGGFQELEFLSLQGITAGTAMAGSGIMCNGANLAFRRDAYLNHMHNLHFDLETGDDVFLLHSIRKKTNSKILWLESPDAVVSTAYSATIESFMRQRKRWISKWNAYSDGFTILTGILVFVAVFLNLFSIVYVFFDISFIRTMLTIILLKSIPDFLVLHNTTSRFGKKHLLRWFLPAQLIYPVYVSGVILYSLIQALRRGD